MWLFSFLCGKNQNSLVCLAMTIWRGAFCMRARTHSTIQYFASYSSVFVFFFSFSFSGLSFAFCLFLAAYEILACDTFFFFVNISVNFILVITRLRENMCTYTREWTVERRREKKWKTTKTVYLRKTWREDETMM